MGYAQHTWTHPEYSPELRHSFGRRQPRLNVVKPEIDSSVDFEDEIEQQDLDQDSASVPYFPLVTFLFIGLVVVLGMRYSSNSRTHQISNFDYGSVERDTFAMLNRDSRLAKASLERKRQLASQVHYVLDIIKTAQKRSPDAKNLAQSIVFESHRANYDPLLVAAVIKSESTFNRAAVSKVGAKGLMQIMPATGQFISKTTQQDWRGANKLHDTQYNLKLGIAYLKQLETKFRGNRELALIAYNWGPANLQKALKNKTHIPSSTVLYARKIMSTHKRWSNDYVQRADGLKYFRIDSFAA